MQLNLTTGFPITYSDGLSNQITFGGLTQRNGGRPAYGYQIIHVDYSEVDTISHYERKAMTDGLNATGITLGGRRVVIDAAAYGTSLGHAWDFAQAFLHSFNPRTALQADRTGGWDVPFLADGFLQLYYGVPTSNATDAPIRSEWLYARPARIPSYRVARERMDDARGYRIDLRAELVCRDPRRYTGQLTTTLSGTPTVVYPGQQAYYANYPSPLEISWTQSSAGATNLTFTIDRYNPAGTVLEKSYAIVMNMASAALENYTIYFDKRVLSASGIIANDLIVSVDGWPEIPPQTAGLVKITATNTTGTVSLRSRTWACFA